VIEYIDAIVKDLFHLSNIELTMFIYLVIPNNSIFQKLEERKVNRLLFD
jgi:hypothetical protein